MVSLRWQTIRRTGLQISAQRVDADPYLDVDHVFEKLRVTAIPKFNGGTYYFTRSPEAAEFFNTARSILGNWREFELREFRRNGPGDEAIFRNSNGLHSLGPTSMGSAGMWTPVGYKGALLLNALDGSCSFEKEGTKLSPEIVHFPGEYAYAFAYARERAKLATHVEGRKNAHLPDY